MARIRKEPKYRKSRAKHFTPPLEMVHKAGENRHLDTPSRASVFATKSLTSTQIREITGVPEQGPETRGRKGGITKDDTAAIANVAEDAGVKLPIVHHLKPPARKVWCNINLEKRPHPPDWDNVAFCNEFHFGIRPKITHQIKRRSGTIKKDKREKARENKHLKLFNIFVIIGKT
ncbi:hypothetical protein V2W45_1519907 [Cenococcum geophilum]